MTQPRLQIKDAIANDGKIDNNNERQPGMTTDAAAVTDGFHLVIEALKLNGLNTIYGLPGIPITDLTRMAQAEGIRVISFRHEQNAGNGIETIEFQGFDDEVKTVGHCCCIGCHTGLPLVVVVDLAIIGNCVFHLEPWLRHRRIPCQ